MIAIGGGRLGYAVRARSVFYGRDLEIEQALMAIKSVATQTIKV
jgi:hypothetical protein